MLILRGPAAARPVDRGYVAAIGNFDGLHLGHQAILARAGERAEALGLPRVVLTFEPHPREYFAPQAPPARLMRLRDKAEWLAQAGIERLAVLRFDARLAAWEPETFVERILDRWLGVRQVVVGRGFRFGRGRAGDVALLRDEGARRGFGVDELEPVEQGGRPVSSTRVREALAAGRMDEAAALLGRPYRISGRVAAGERLGRRLGFPTVNIPLRGAAPPLAGIFAVRVAGVGDGARPGVASVGTRPTTGGGPWMLEVHLFDFDGDLYGRRLGVDFIRRLRDEVRFPDLEAMTVQMHEDARQARAVLAARG